MASETAPVARTDDSLAEQDEAPALISSLTYRSRAVAPMSELDLHRLARAAQLRNSAEGVTGLMVYDRGWIFQRLEGPTDGVARIWASIRKDPRHVAIEVVSDGPSEKRQFEDWDLRLSVRGAQAGLGERGMADGPPEMISRLCRGEVPADLLGVSAPLAFEKRVPLVAASEALLLSRAALSELISTVIVPRLCAARAVSLPLPLSLSAELASLLIAVDAASAFALVKAALYRYVSLGSLITELLEPAARDLGDLWQSDDCTEIEVTLGLGRLQAIAREFGQGSPRLTALHPPVVLVAPQPGEAHMLGATLDAEMLWQAGWSPRVDFPPSSGALDSLVASTWIDAVDLSLSTSFQRDHRLTQVGKTITSARLASLNPHLVVVVSGRVFSDLAKAGDSVATLRRIGADGIFGSAAQAESAILQALRSAQGGQHSGSGE
ncbi:MAG: BLUF domain-containing protein [Rhizobiales bacterium]|nr:BLUF domain-containing protein [Rhizobacter sp.]